MRARRRHDSMGYGRLLDADQVMAYLGMGRDSAIRFAKKCGSARKYGKITRYDREVLDAAVDAMRNAEAKPEGGQDNAENLRKTF